MIDDSFQPDSDWTETQEGGYLQQRWANKDGDKFLVRRYRSPDKEYAIWMAINLSVPCFGVGQVIYEQSTDTAVVNGVIREIRRINDRKES